MCLLYLNIIVRQIETVSKNAAQVQSEFHTRLYDSIFSENHHKATVMISKSVLF